MKTNKRTKIVCTIGPASSSKDVLRRMVRAGMNVARLNFSHGTYAEHAAFIKKIRAAAKKEGEPVAILQDLQGPKIRVGELPKIGVQLKNGTTVIFSTKSKKFVQGVKLFLPVTYKNLHKDVKVGHRIFLDDGLLEVKVEKISGQEIFARVVNGGKLTSHKGMNFPDSTLRVAAVSEKDKADLVFGLKHGVDMVALSFVTSAADVKGLRTRLKKNKVQIIVKIEKHEAITKFDEILAAADGVMIARGDLGVEIPAEEVPLRQKEIVEKSRRAGKPVIVATQMLDSMTRNPRPTRAEVSDVANAVIDHADAVMLSGESASGAYPVETVEEMAKIIRKTEASVFDDLSVKKDASGGAEAIVSHSLRLLAARHLIHGVLSATFLTPMAEKFNLSRPETPLFIAADTEGTVRCLNLRWGVFPFFMKKSNSVTFVKKSLEFLSENNLVKNGQKIALVLGHKTGFEILEV